MKILLVEDNLLNQKVVSFHLKKKNYEVICAGNWKEALHIYMNDTPDLILMDIMLPEKNGYEITGEIRQLEKNSGRSPGIPIIALTANTLDNDKEKCIKAGMNDYLPKPFTPGDMYEIIEEYIVKH